MCLQRLELSAEVRNTLLNSREYHFSSLMSSPVTNHNVITSSAVGILDEPTDQHIVEDILAMDEEFEEEITETVLIQGYIIYKLFIDVFVLEECVRQNASGQDTFRRTLVSLSRYAIKKEDYNVLVTRMSLEKPKGVTSIFSKNKMSNKQM